MRRFLSLALVLPFSLALAAGERGAPASGGESVHSANIAAPGAFANPAAAADDVVPTAPDPRPRPQAPQLPHVSQVPQVSQLSQVSHVSHVGLERPDTSGPRRQRPMATVPAGDYLPLYSPDTTPVSVASFRMDTHPVTRAEFATFVAANPRWGRGEVPAVFADGRYLRNWADAAAPGERPDSPVTHVSWFAARAYCDWEGKRLPTVDEWEYAARADETRRDAMADPSHKARILELYTGRPEAPPPVGTVFRNTYGIHDMHGLVWEWVRDFNTVTVGTDSRGTSQRDAQLYCAAGAEGATDTGNYAAFLRYAFRASLQGRATSAALGFRCAADIPLR